MACLINLLNNGVDGVDGFYGFNGVFDNLPYFASYELEEVLKRQMSPADTLFENRAVVLLERSAKWLRTKKELMEAFLRAEGLLLKPTTPAQKVAIHIVPSRNAFFFSSTLTIPLAQLSLSVSR